MRWSARMGRGPRWSGEDWASWDRRRAGQEGADGAGSAGRERERGRACGRAEKGEGAVRYGGHKADYFAKQLASVQRELAALKGNTKGRPEDSRSRSATPRSSTGGDATSRTKDSEAGTGEVKLAPESRADLGGSHGSAAVAEKATHESALADWEAAKCKIDEALTAAREAACGAAVSALEGQLGSLGPKPEPPPPAPKQLSAWTLAQRARRFAAKSARKLASADATRLKASAEAERAAAALVEAEKLFQQATVEHDKARAQEDSAVAALQAASAAKPASQSVVQPRGTAPGAPLEAWEMVAAAMPMPNSPEAAAALQGAMRLVAGALGELVAGSVVQDAVPAPVPAARGAVTGVPRRAPWADQDALDADCDGGAVETDIDDGFADGLKRACPDDELNACGGRKEEEGAEAKWSQQRFRCRRSEVPRAHSADASPGGGPMGQPRHAGSSRSPCRGGAGSVGEVRRAVQSVQLTMQAPAFAKAQESACKDLMHNLQAASGAAPAARQEPPAHPVFVAAGGRIHSTC